MKTEYNHCEQVQTLEEGMEEDWERDGLDNVKSEQAHCLNHETQKIVMYESL